MAQSVERPDNRPDDLQNVFWFQAWSREFPPFQNVKIGYEAHPVFYSIYIKGYVLPPPAGKSAEVWRVSLILIQFRS